MKMRKLSYVVLLMFTMILSSCATATTPDTAHSSHKSESSKISSTTSSTNKNKTHKKSKTWETEFPKNMRGIWYSNSLGFGSDANKIPVAQVSSDSIEISKHKLAANIISDNQNYTTNSKVITNEHGWYRAQVKDKGTVGYVKLAEHNINGQKQKVIYYTDTLILKGKNPAIIFTRQQIGATSLQQLQKINPKDLPR